jgi:hypothetical protein
VLEDHFVVKIDRILELVDEHIAANLFLEGGILRSFIARIINLIQG